MKYHLLYRNYCKVLFAVVFITTETLKFYCVIFSELKAN